MHHNLKIVDVLDSRHKENLEQYFHNISLNERKNVQFFSIDLYDTYRAIGKKYFPNAIICADAFHVIKNLSSFLHKIRIRIMHKFENLKYSHDNYYWLLKRYPKLLTRDKSKLGYTKFKVNKQGQYMNEHEIVEYILSLDDQLKKAYDIYQEYLVSNQIATIDMAEQWLNQLIDDYKASNITEYVPAWKLLENWHDEIINSFNRVNGYRISNGPMERVNESIKTIFRLSFGSRNFTRMRNRIMYVINDNSAILYERKKKTNKYKGKPRGPYNKNKQK